MWSSMCPHPPQLHSYHPLHSALSLTQSINQSINPSLTAPFLQTASLSMDLFGTGYGPEIKNPDGRGGERHFNGMPYLFGMVRTITVPSLRHPCAIPASSLPHSCIIPAPFLR